MKSKYLLLFFVVCFSQIAGAQKPQWAIYPVYEYISDFNEGIAAVKQNGKWGYIDLHGNIVTPIDYGGAFPFSDGMGVLTSSDNRLLAIVDVNKKITKISSDVKIDPRFPSFCDGYLLVSKNDKWGYLKKDGTIGIDCKYIDARPFNEGLASVRFSPNDGWFYIKQDGETAISISLKIYWASGFHEGHAVVLYGKTMGFIDSKGNKLTSPKLPDVTLPSASNPSYQQSVLKCAEGNLELDHKGRIVKYIPKKGDIIEFIAPDAKRIPNLDLPIDAEQINWQNISTAIVKTSGKYGVVTISDTPAVSFSAKNNILGSVFGNDVQLDYNINNLSKNDINKLHVNLGDQLLQEIERLKQGESSLLSIPITKESDLAKEKIDLLFTAIDHELMIGKNSLSIEVNDVPSIEISFPSTEKSVQRGERICQIEIDIKNKANIDLVDAKMNVNGESKNVSVKAGETIRQKFQLQLPVTTLNVSVKPLKSPEVTVSQNINIRFIEINNDDKKDGDDPPPPPPV